MEVVREVGLKSAIDCMRYCLPFGYSNADSDRRNNIRSTCALSDVVQDLSVIVGHANVLTAAVDILISIANSPSRGPIRQAGDRRGR